MLVLYSVTQCNQTETQRKIVWSLCRKCSLELWLALCIQGARLRWPHHEKGSTIRTFVVYTKVLSDWPTPLVSHVTVQFCLIYQLIVPIRCHLGFWLWAASHTLVFLRSHQLLVLWPIMQGNWSYSRLPLAILTQTNIAVCKKKWLICPKRWLS